MFIRALAPPNLYEILKDKQFFPIKPYAYIKFAKVVKYPCSFVVISSKLSIRLNSSLRIRSINLDARCLYLFFTESYHRSRKSVPTGERYRIEINFPAVVRSRNGDTRLKLHRFFVYVRGSLNVCRGLREDVHAQRIRSTRSQRWREPAWQRIRFAPTLSLAITLHPPFVSSDVETLRVRPVRRNAGLRNCFTAPSRGL